MWSKHRLIASWAIGACLVLVPFYAAMAWLWSAAEESKVASLEREVVSALASDLAEGNLLKLSATLAKLQQDGHLRFAEIRRLPDTNGSGFVFRTTGPDERTDAVFAEFRCGEQRKIAGHPRRGLSLITTLPGSTAGAECAALYIGSDFPRELIRFKNRLTASFGILVACLFGFFFWFITSWYQRILKLEVEKESAVRRIAEQVAHDIRSPLAALDSVLNDLSQLPEEKRVLIRSAVGRIRDIANNLIAKNRTAARVGSGSKPEAHEAEGESGSVQLLSGLVDSLITEKRLQFRSQLGVEIDSRLDPSSYGLFAAIPASEFKRVLSNLINNAVESLPGKGLVTIRLASSVDGTEIVVRDSGQGIPPDVLARLGQRGETHGKPGGSGLGLHHARTSVESWGGSLTIDSEPGRGTTVAIRLPRARPPEWFVSEVAISPGASIVVLDDDSSIHQVWQERFESAHVKDHGVAILHFSTPAELRSWTRTDPRTAKDPLYLMDYELVGYRETGLSLAEELGIGARTILVTSRYEEKGVLADSLRLKARLIPKSLAGFVPMRIEKKEAPERFDAVLIDDDPLTRMNWKMAASRSGKKFQSFSTVPEFLKEAPEIGRETHVYIDANLADDVDGAKESLKIHELGFMKIYLATGHEAARFAAYKHLSGVAGKEPPWS
ncbi:MAG: hypothetical protein A2X40_06710 [Elusimicrobia bacterium GWC2_65_9]|nr:MAG: hypothetical protein A2X40_06710 [Elusimicrobia bacterium GWC2_65_9]